MTSRIILDIGFALSGICPKMVYRVVRKSWQHDLQNHSQNYLDIGFALIRSDIGKLECVPVICSNTNLTSASHYLDIGFALIRSDIGKLECVPVTCSNTKLLAHAFILASASHPF